MSKRNIALIVALVVAVGALVALLIRMYQKKQLFFGKGKDNCFSVDASDEDLLPIESKAEADVETDEQPEEQTEEPAQAE